MNANERREFKINLKVKELDNLCSGHNELLNVLVHITEKLSVPIILIIEDNQLKDNELCKRAKIKWESSGLPRKALAIMIDAKNLRGLDFLFALAHECGHLKDFDKGYIELQSQRSEVSAWTNAYEFVKPYFSEEDLQQKFFRTAQEALKSYLFHIESLSELAEIDLMNVSNEIIDYRSNQPI